jgi:plastocyanin
MRITRILATAVAAAAAAFVLAAPGSAEGTKIFGSVGPGFTIALTDASGTAITKLDPGPYELVVNDKSEFHNFRLNGPGVSIATSVEGMGEETFQITVADGKYTYACDPHSGSMFGSFTVGAASAAPTVPARPKVAAAKFSAPVGSTLDLTVGPTFSITLATKAGKPVTNLKAGAYTFVVRDRAANHNAHIAGPGVDKATAVTFVGRKTFKLTLRKGKLTFVCDPHRTGMKGSVAVS